MRERDREARLLLRQALVVDRGRVGIMVAMFVPQTRVPMETINWLALVPATFIQVWAGAPLLPRGVAGRPPRHGEHGHADRGRDDGRLALQRRRDALPGGHPRGRAPPGDLLRLVDDHHRPRPARSLARGPGQGRHGRRDPPAHRPPADDRPPRRRRPRDRRPARGGRRRRPAAGPARREGAGRRRRRRGRVGRRREHAHRRADPGRGRAGREVIGGDAATRPARS